MAIFRAVKPEEWNDSVFKRIGTDWMLVGAPKQDGMNLMTASWGGMGILWHKPVVFIFVRPQRYTRELLDAAGRFSLTFYGEAFREQLNLCGAQSGRDTDKVAACGFDLLYEEKTPYPAQADIAVICKKLYRQQLDRRSFAEQGMAGILYPDGDRHIQYIGEIEKLLVREG